MKYKRLYTAGDGFCFNHHWPMWSRLLATILDCKWTNLSTYGAGNEAIANLVIDAVDDAPEDSLFFVQWTGAKRFDLRIDGNKDIVTEISADPVYHDNFIETQKGKTYWCSSASTLNIAKQYNNSIPESQHIDRSRMHQLAVAYALTQRNFDWYYLSTVDIPWALPSLVPESKWIWPSMQSFRYTSQYKNLDVGEVQPVSSIHLDFLEQFVLPNLTVDQDRFQKIKDKILSIDQKRIDKQ